MCGVGRGTRHEQHLSYISGGANLKYQGCFDTENSIHNAMIEDRQPYTPNTCIVFCRDFKSKYAGLTVLYVSNMFSWQNRVSQCLCVIIYTRGCACVGGYVVWRRCACE